MFAAIFIIVGMAMGVYFALKRFNRKIAIAVAIAVVALGCVWLFNIISKIHDI